MKLPKFHSIEEVKEFIGSTDNSKIGAITFVDKDGNLEQISMDEFIEKVGLDNAAAFIFENAKVGIGASKDDFNKIIEKFEKDPASLTDEEKTIMLLMLENIANDNSINDVNSVFSMILKTFLDFGEGLTNNYAGVLSILLTLMESLFVLSSDLSICYDNKSIYNEMVKSVTDQIIIPEEIDEASLLVGLIHIIGERYINSNLTKNMVPNYHTFAKEFSLDMEFLFEETNENIVDTTKESVEQYKKEIMPDVKRYLKLENETPSTDSNIVNLDIRKTLKNNKKNN